MISRRICSRDLKHVLVLLRLFSARPPPSAPRSLLTADTDAKMSVSPDAAIPPFGIKDDYSVPKASASHGLSGNSRLYCAARFVPNFPIRGGTRVQCPPAHVAPVAGTRAGRQTPQPHLPLHRSEFTFLRWEIKKNQPPARRLLRAGLLPLTA